MNKVCQSKLSDVARLCGFPLQRVWEMIQLLCQGGPQDAELWLHNHSAQQIVVELRAWQESEMEWAEITDKPYECFSFIWNFDCQKLGSPRMAARCARSAGLSFEEFARAYVSAYPVGPQPVMFVEEMVAAMEAAEHDGYADSGGSYRREPFTESFIYRMRLSFENAEALGHLSRN